ncbi:MAG: ABC transporter ATP-binding protein [Acidobacteriota bacterium]
MSQLFEAIDLNLHFGGVYAVRDVGFRLQQGEVFSIIGPNGAGKTTVLNLISRLYDCEPGGRMLFEGRDITQIPPHGVARAGIARTFQNTELFEHDTVLKNLLIGRHVHRRTHLLQELLFTPVVRRQELDFRRVAEDVIDLLDLQHYRDRVIAGLPYGIRKLVEVGRALCLQPKLLLLDEPSSGLNPEETEDVAFWIEDINQDFGATIILVEHDMNLVRQVSDRVMAMADGRVLTTGLPAEVQQHPDVLRAYLGDEEPAMEAVDG